ncbi:G-alpha-domain-containing protein [Meira miltonrushii]|uniref:G-alpha-domain-containing protein n=1 Tax=Meira miltonrushii TaxID=1280837 RepID=A0A316VDC0_9BASI|nr:G-alpha-domain-containing protein [Meira miltonrushii]PWN35088.1 G-alpha-domain-containing protein [Meira miltonrushii]
MSCRMEILPLQPQHMSNSRQRTNYKRQSLLNIHQSIHTTIGYSVANSTSTTLNHHSTSFESPVFGLPQSKPLPPSPQEQLQLQQHSRSFSISRLPPTPIKERFSFLEFQKKMLSNAVQNRKVRNLSSAFGSNGVTGRVKSLTLKSGRRSKDNLRGTGNDEDPLSIALRPPNNETEEEKQERIQAEVAAKKRSDDIDKTIREEASRAKDDRTAEKTILLLGQAEAGKTTIMKQMRMMYAPERQERLRNAWTDVIYLNIVLAVKRLVEVQTMQNGKSAIRRMDSTQSISSPVLSSLSPSRATSPTHQTFEEAKKSHSQNSKMLLLKLRFAPLLSMEAELRGKLGTLDETVIQQRRPQQEVRRSSSFSHESLTLSSKLSPLVLKANWQDKMLTDYYQDETEQHTLTESTARKSLSSRFARKAAGRSLSNASTDTTYHSGGLQDETTQPMRKKMYCLLDATKKDIIDLWRKFCKGDLVKDFSNDSTAYFLSNIERFASPDFKPTDDDILRARVRTLGVFEERFYVNRHMSYRIVDVGGSRSQRNVWAQFFYNATAIIFLAPISAFDEMLSEDVETNKVVDSLEIWKQIVSSPLLLKVSLILFLNKMDILELKLLKGIRVRDHFKRYKGPNEFEDVWRYFRSLFLLVARDQEGKAPTRSLYVHRTTATSTTEIRSILTSCQDIILRQHLRDSALT